MGLRQSDEVRGIVEELGIRCEVRSVQLTIPANRHGPIQRWALSDAIADQRNDVRRVLGSLCTNVLEVVDAGDQPLPNLRLAEA
jgi:hypothetical protein